MKFHWFGIILSASCVLLHSQEREIEKEDDQSQRQEWFYQERAYPLGHIPTGARLNAIRALQDLERATRGRRIAAGGATTTAGAASRSANASAWTLIGPRPTDAGSTYITAGRVNAIAIDPRDQNVVYIGGAEGGVWKSTDGGATWIPITDSRESLATGAIALDPSNPDIVYVGTGEENFSYDSYYGAGLLKSINGGATWTNLASDVFLRARIGSLAVHPSNGQIVLASSDSGIWRSVDGGTTWSKTLSGAAGTKVLFDPSNPDVAYAALGTIFGNARNGVYKSTDKGQSWTAAMGSGSNALPLVNVGRIEIALAPSSSSTLYIGIQNSDTNSFGGLLGMFKSTDGAATWNKLTVPSSLCAKQCWYDMTIQVHPSNPDIAFAGGFLIYRTMDGGSTWSGLPAIGPNRTELHVDEHFLAFTPDASKLYIANDGGMFSTTDISTRAVSWTNLNDTLAVTQFSPNLSVHPTDPNIAYGGTQDNGTQRYSGSLSWNSVTCGDGGSSAIDPSLPSIVFAACQNIDIRRTVNGGDAWLPARYGFNQSDRAQFLPPLVVDPSSAQVLYFGTFRVWQSVDGSGRWAAISPDLSKGGTIKTIAIAPSDTNVIYAGTSDGKVQVTTNARNSGGVSWTDRTAGLPNRAVTHISVDPLDSGTAYATFSGFSMGLDTAGHIFRTNDGGASWTDISGNLPNMPANDVVVDPDLPDTLYVATDAGVLATTDGGRTWTSAADGLPRAVVISVALQRSTRTLFAATHGRSVWNLGLPLSGSSSQPAILSVSPSAIDAGPNGFTLVVTGNNFVSGTVLRWNGQDRPTTLIDSHHLNVQIPASDIANVGRVTLAVFSPMRGGGASTPISFQIGPAPRSQSNAFVSAANPTGGSALSPRSIASLYGVNLASGVSISDALPPLPFQLGGTSLTLADNPVPLFFVSPGQINFQVPFIVLTGPTQVPLVITQGTLSTTIMVTLTPYSPALFTTNSQGTGQASALIASSGTIVAPGGAFPDSRPARHGEFISLYATGLGDVTNRPGLGGPSPSNPLAATLANPIVSIGNVPAIVSFSGLAPGFVGLYQVNVQIPDAAPTGNAVPVMLTIGGQMSNTATIAIQ